MERKTLFLIAGAATAAVVGVVLLIPASKNGADVQPVASSKAADTAIEIQASGGEVERSIGAIQAMPVSSAIRKRLIVEYLAATVAPQPQAFAYWEPSALREAHERIRKYETDEAVRRKLRAEQGEAVAEDPEYAFLFRPYDDRYPALPVTKQLELQKLSMMPVRALAAADASPIQAQVAVKGAQHEMEAEIAKLLTAQELQEYRRKESPAARSLAGGGFRFTQQEFDAVLPAVAQNTEGVPTRRFDAETTEKLRGIMGETRYLEYRKSQDPTFHMLSAIVADHGKQGANVDAAYAAIYKNQEAASKALSAGPVPGFDASRNQEQMAADLRTQLVTNIGGEATDILLRSLDANRGLVQTRMF